MFNESLHVVGLPHTSLTDGFGCCAYTQKVRKFVKMMRAAGVKTNLYYGGEKVSQESPLFSASGEMGVNVNCLSVERQAALYSAEPWFQKGRYFEPTWDSRHPAWIEFNSGVSAALHGLAKPGEFLCLIGGLAHEPIARAHTELVTTEFGIGYEGVFSNFRVFESYAWMHHVYGLRGEKDGRFFDAVIPNFFDLEEFPQWNPRSTRDYFVFLSRVTPRKGYQIAVEMTKRLGAKLFVGGLGSEEDLGGHSHVEHLGYLNPLQRNEVLSQARALLAPTQYIEPFGGVVVEAFLSGCPVITTDWGAFTETVKHGRNGYRCRTLEQFTWAGRNIASLKMGSQGIRRDAVEEYSLGNVSEKYIEYFSMLSSLKGAGWYAEHPIRRNLSWLDR